MFIPIMFNTLSGSGILPAVKTKYIVYKDKKIIYNKEASLEQVIKNKRMTKEEIDKLYDFVRYFLDHRAEDFWGDAVETLTVGYNANTRHLYRGWGE